MSTYKFAVIIDVNDDVQERSLYPYIATIKNVTRNCIEAKYMAESYTQLCHIIEAHEEMSCPALRDDQHLQYDFTRDAWLTAAEIETYTWDADTKHFMTDDRFVAGLCGYKFEQVRQLQKQPDMIIEEIDGKEVEVSRKSGDMFYLDDGELYRRAAYQRDLFVTIAAYSTERRYGGPEEGGWYYEDGMLLDDTLISLPYTCSDELLAIAVNDLRNYMTEQYSKSFTFRLKIHSTRSIVKNDYYNSKPLTVRLCDTRPIYC